MQDFAAHLAHHIVAFSSVSTALISCKIMLMYLQSPKEVRFHYLPVPHLLDECPKETTPLYECLLQWCKERTCIIQLPCFPPWFFFTSKFISSSRPAREKILLSSTNSSDKSNSATRFSFCRILFAQIGSYS